MPSQTAKHLSAGINRVVELYQRGRKTVGTVLMDNEFEPLPTSVPNLVVNTTAAKEHVPEIERRICLINKRVRGILNTLPFWRRIPRCILVELIYHVALWLNAFPMKSGVLATTWILWIAMGCCSSGTTRSQRLTNH